MVRFLLSPNYKSMYNHKKNVIRVWSPCGPALCVAAVLAIAIPKTHAAGAVTGRVQDIPGAESTADLGYSDGLGGFGEQREPTIGKDSGSRLDDLQTMAKKKTKKKKKTKSGAS